MTELNKIFESHWLSRIDKYRHTPRVNFGVGAVDKIGELAKEIAKNTKCMNHPDSLSFYFKPWIAAPLALLGLAKTGGVRLPCFVAMTKHLI